MKFTLSGIFFCLFNVCLSAQTWETPVLEATKIQDGSVYYVQNTGLNLQIAAGAD